MENRRLLEEWRMEDYWRNGEWKIIGGMENKILLEEWRMEDY